jgi:hypothetical protein
MVYASEHYFHWSEPYHGCWICEAGVMQFMWKQGLQASRFCCQLSHFLKPLFSVWQLSLSVKADVCLLFLFAHVVFQWTVYANVTFEAVTLDTPNNVAVFVTDTPAKCAWTICPLPKTGWVSHFPILSQELSFNTITNALAWAPQSQHEQILFFNILVFP